jgi:hypothetical protein
MKKFLIIFVSAVVLIAGGYFFAGHETKKEAVNIQDNNQKNAVQQTSEPQATNSENKSNQQPSDSNIPQKIEQNVAFTSQAPFANWKNPMYQNGCEEASMVMAMSWVNGAKAITPQDADTQIKNLTSWEDKNIGYDTDTDPKDMQKIFENYYHYQKVKVRENVSADDIKAELKKGNVVLVPAYGRALGNPNFTSPGPVTHMLVVIGYDPVTKNFITNDPGTRKGKEYQYSEKVLFEANWEYPSGPVLPDPPKGALKKAILVVEPKNA